MAHILTTATIGEPDGPAPVTDPTFIGTVTIPEIQFEVPHTPGSVTNGLMYWDDDHKTISVVVDESEGVIMQVGQEIYARCVNKTGTQINDGSVVYINGAQGNRPTIALAKADAVATCQIIGVATENIPDNEEGFITTFGSVHGIDTSAWVTGTKLYLSPTTAGELTDTPPTDTYYMVPVATTQNQTINGTLFIAPQRPLMTDKSFAAASNLVGATSQAVKDYVGHEVTKDHTGFYEPENITISYDSTTRKITLTGTVAGYYRGVRVAELVSGWVSPEIPVIPTVPYFLYYDGSGFHWTSTPWTFDKMMIAFVSYDTAGNFRFAVRETHGLMQWTVHRELHEENGTYLRSGGDISAYVLNSTTAANRRPDVAVAYVADEDLQSTIPALSTKSYTQVYLTGAGVSTFALAQADIIPITGTTPYYNQFTGGAWTQTAVPANQYTTVFLVAMPVTADAASQEYRYLWIQGQSAGTLAAMQSYGFGNLNLGQYTNLAVEFIAIGKIIVRNTGANWELTSVEKLVGTRSGGVSPSGNFLSAVTTDTTLTGAGTASSPLGVVTANLLHNSLGTLNGGTSGQYYHLTSAEYTGTGTGNFVRLNAPSVTGTWSFSGQINSSNATASTSTATGALVVAGGVGIGGTLYATTGRFIGSAFIGDGSTSATYVINGAASTAKSAIYRTAGSNRWALGVSTSSADPFVLTAYDDSGVAIENVLSIVRLSGGAISSLRPISFTNSTASTSTTTGALVVTGGVGIGGALYGTTATFSGAVTGSSFTGAGNGLTGTASGLEANTATYVKAASCVGDGTSTRFLWDGTTIYRTDWQGRQRLYSTARTNLITYSQDFSNAAWNPTNSGTGSLPVITADAGLAPDGTTTADRVVFSRGAGTTSSDYSVFSRVPSRTQGISYEQSIWLKSNTGSSQNVLINFVGMTGGSSSNVVTVTASWQRFSIASLSTQTGVGIQFGTRQTYGDASLDLLVWGYQIAESSAVTSYIPTTTTAVTVTDYTTSGAIATLASAPIAGSLLQGLSDYRVGDTYTVAALPVAPPQNYRAFASDANATTYNSVVAGGGANYVPVFFDGAAWRIG